MQNKKSDKKREFILTKAKDVFIRKGFTLVTMKDIIEECEISRGGIYLYFKSVDEIFMQVITLHNESKLKDARERIQQNKSFKEIIDGYFNKHKNRLLNMDNSLLMAMHEYRFSHKEEQDKKFYQSQFLHTKDIILELLKYGVKQGEISENGIDDLAVNIMFFIEGISTMAIAFYLDEKTIDSQIKFIKDVIYSHTERKKGAI